MSPKKFVQMALRDLILGEEDGWFNWPTIFIPKILTDKWWKEAVLAQEVQLYAPTPHEGFWIRVWNYIRTQRAKMIQEMEWPD